MAPEPARGPPGCGGRCPGLTRAAPPGGGGRTALLGLRHRPRLGLWLGPCPLPESESLSGTAARRSQESAAGLAGKGSGSRKPAPRSRSPGPRGRGAVGPARKATGLPRGSPCGGCTRPSEGRSCPKSRGVRRVVVVVVVETNTSSRRRQQQKAETLMHLLQVHRGPPRTSVTTTRPRPRERRGERQGRGTRGTSS